MLVNDVAVALNLRSKIFLQKASTIGLFQGLGKLFKSFLRWIELVSWQNVPTRCLRKLSKSTETTPCVVLTEIFIKGTIQHGSKTRGNNSSSSFLKGIAPAKEAVGKLCLLRRARSSHQGEGSTHLQWFAMHRDCPPQQAALAVPSTNSTGVHSASYNNVGTKLRACAWANLLSSKSEA